MIVALLGGLLARGHLTSAITSAGAVVDATHKLDSANAQRAFEEWKIQSANGLKMAKYTLDQLNSALKEEETDSRAGQARTTTLLNSLKLTELQKLHDSDPEAYKRALLHLGKAVQSTEAGAKTFDDQQTIVAAMNSDDPEQVVKGIHDWVGFNNKHATKANANQTFADGIKMDAIAQRIEAAAKTGDQAALDAAIKDGQALMPLGRACWRP